MLFLSDAIIVSSSCYNCSGTPMAYGTVAYGYYNVMYNMTCGMPRRLPQLRIVAENGPVEVATRVGDLGIRDSKNKTK